MNLSNIILTPTTGPLLTIIGLLLVAGLIGYVTAWYYAKSVYTPVIKGLGEDKLRLGNEITGLKGDISNLNNSIDRLSGQVTNLEGEIAEKEKIISGMEDKINELKKKK